MHTCLEQLATLRRTREETLQGWGQPVAHPVQGPHGLVTAGGLHLGSALPVRAWHPQSRFKSTPHAQATWPRPVTLPQVLPCRVKGKGRCQGDPVCESGCRSPEPLRTQDRKSVV